MWSSQRGFAPQNPRTIGRTGCAPRLLDYRQRAHFPRVGTSNPWKFPRAHLPVSVPFSPCKILRFQWFADSPRVGTLRKLPTLGTFFPMAGTFKVWRFFQTLKVPAFGSMPFFQWLELPRSVTCSMRCMSQGLEACGRSLPPQKGSLISGRGLSAVLRGRNDREKRQPAGRAGDAEAFRPKRHRTPPGPVPSLKC